MTRHALFPAVPGSVRARPVLPGDTIGVVAPSGPVPQEVLNQGVAWLQSQGYRVALGDRVLARHGYLAGSDAERAADFNAVWANPAVKGVICARGGYGAMRILEHIDWKIIRQQPKFFCGFSDITALHAAIEKQAGLITFHGPMVGAIGAAQVYNKARLLTALQQPVPLGTVPWPETETQEEAPKPAVIRAGLAEGRLLGGNLALLCALMGTPWEPDFTGRIVVIEDIDEAPYRMDRMLVQLLLGGKLQKAAGILFGDSPSCMHGAEGKPSLTLAQVLEELLVPLGIPVLYGFPCGHTGYRATLPLGAMARLDAGAATLSLTEAALTA